MKVIVIVVTYNGLKWIDKCIGSIQNSSIPLDAMVVDNGSMDGTQEYIKERYPDVLFHQSPVNLGFGQANNIGLQYALDNNYDYVYLLNQDAWVMTETIETLINIQRKKIQYGILSPFQLQANMQHFDNNFVQGVCSWESNPCLLEDMYFHRLRDVYSVPAVMAAHWLISRDCLLKVGGFSPIFPHYGEDNNYAERTIFHGFKIGIVPGAIAIHDREYREISAEKRMYMSYVGGLILLSGVSQKYSNLRVRLFWQMLRTMLINSSFTPLKNFFQTMKAYSKIRKSVKTSRGVCAFLKQNA